MWRNKQWTNRQVLDLESRIDDFFGQTFKLKSLCKLWNQKTNNKQTKHKNNLFSYNVTTASIFAFAIFDQTTQAIKTQKDKREKIKKK